MNDILAFPLTYRATWVHVFCTAVGLLELSSDFCVNHQCSRITDNVGVFSTVLNAPICRWIGACALRQVLRPNPDLP